MNKHTDKNSSALKAVKLTWKLMAVSERRKGLIIAALSIFASLIETVALISVMPLVSLLIDPEVVNNNEMVKVIYDFLGISDFSLFVKTVAFISVMLIILSGLANFLVMLITKNYRISCQNRLAKKLISRCLNAPYIWLVRQNSSVLSHNVFNDVLSWSSGGIHGVMAIIGHLSLLILVGIIILSAATYSGLAGLLIVGIIASLIMYFIRSKIKHLSVFRRVAAAKSYSFASELIGGIKDVKLSGREGKFINIYVSTFDQYGSAMGMLKLLQAVPPLSMLFLGQISVILISLFLWSIGKTGAEIATEMALVLLVTARAIPVITKLSSEISVLWNVIPNIEGINYVLENSNKDGIIENKCVENIQEINEFKNWEYIELNDVVFKYLTDAKPALSNVSLILEKGKSYGIVGPTGAGKTTVVDIILGLLQPTTGKVCINGKHLNLMNSRIWQQQIGYIPQTPLIIDDTLLANIAFGVSEDSINIDHVMHCIEMANIKDVVDSITLQGSVGENGNNLSGGQKQRVAIARALYDSPEILVMDEATSSLDNISERAIQTSLNNLKGKVTTITIAHRLSTIENCDKIFVIDKGKLIASGNYYALINNCELFNEMTAVHENIDSN